MFFNDAGMAKLAADCARDVVGDDMVIDHLDAPNMGGEDFAYYLEKAPGAFMFLSSSNPEKHRLYYSGFVYLGADVLATYHPYDGRGFEKYR